jgi:hypothetical protein
MLDCDTIVLEPFTFGDFDKHMTRSIAFSAEMDEDLKEPWNAGVALMNLPYLRQTYNDFLEVRVTKRESDAVVSLNIRQTYLLFATRSSYIRTPPTSPSTSN